MNSYEQYISQCNQVAPCHLVMADELHYAENGCDYESNSNDKYSCGESYEWHSELVYEIENLIKCTNHKGE